MAVALLVAGPLLVLPASFIVLAGRAVRTSRASCRMRLRATAILLVGVGLGTLVLGTGLAALVSFCDFPGRSWLEWALVLPLAMPGYVFTLFALGAADAWGSWRGRAVAGGAVVVFTLVLYPYVYLLARNAFLAQGPDAGRGGPRAGPRRARARSLRVAVPMARPAILGGVALALMESLADFGTVNLLGVQTFTNAIYKVWFGAFDRDAALQLGTLLVSITLMLLLLERLSRGRARYARRSQRTDGGSPVRLRGAGGRGARCGVPLLLVALVVAAPLAQLAVWSIRVDLRRSGSAGVRRRCAQQPDARRDVDRASWWAWPLVLAYGRARAARRVSAGAVRTATIGYGIPGSVVAVAVIVPLGWLDHRLDDAGRGGAAAHGHRDRALRRLLRTLSRPGLPVGGHRAWSGFRARSTRPRAAWGRTASTCWPACTCR